MMKYDVISAFLFFAEVLDTHAEHAIIRPQRCIQINTGDLSAHLKLINAQINCSPLYS